MPHPPQEILNSERTQSRSSGFFESAFIPHHGFPFPLVNIQKTMEKNTIVHGKIHYK
jgi:hypothetical protein